MRPLFVRRRYAFVRVDSGSVILIPLLVLTVAIGLGHLLISIGLVMSIYSSPFVALSAFVSNRVCLRAGLVTSFLSVLAHEFFFVAPLGFNWPSPEHALAYAANFAAAYLVARRVPLDTTPRRNDLGAAALPFVGSTTATPEKSFWVVDGGGGDWTEDCVVGSEYARLYLAHARTPLPWIMKDMVAAGKWTGVEAGFCAVVGRAAALGRKNLEAPPSIPHDDADNLEQD